MEMAGSSNALDVSAPTQDFKFMFMMASNVNVSNFVSIKLSGRSNYDIWKAQMLCLIKSQMLLHTIDAKNPFPEDKGVHMIEQYNQLVKGWIFGSVNQKVLKDLVDLGSGQEVWMKLESLFNSPISDTEDDSSNGFDVIAPVVSAIREDLKYLQASNVNVSNFVSLKLAGKSNYDTWKSEILCLIRSHDLLHIIHADFRFPEDADPITQNYDNLVKGWILSTMNDQVRHNFRFYRSVQLMWRNLESTFTIPPESESHRKGPDDSSNVTEDLKYMEASNVNLSNFVSEKLSGDDNYHIWKAQMLCLLETHDLLQLLHGSGPLVKKKFDDLVRGWIFGTIINDQLLKDFPGYIYVKDVWEELESRIKYGPLWHEPVVSASTQDLKYMQASNVNVSNFVSVKLTGLRNYKIWKNQILCLLESQDLLHIIDHNKSLAGGKYNILVKGWILGAMSEELLADFTNYDSAKHIWRKLESSYNPLESDSNRQDDTSPGFQFRTEFGRVPEIADADNSRLKKELYEAAVEGCWWKAKSILKNNKNKATETITNANGNTILHLAVEMGHNYFLEKLLEFVKDKKYVETKNEKGQTALHIASRVGNTHAAHLLVQKGQTALDNDGESPLDYAYDNMKLDTYACLLKSALPSDLHTHSDASKSDAICFAILEKEYELAQTLLEKFPECAKEDKRILLAITIIFPSDLGFMESFIYPSFNNVRQKTIVRCSLLFHPNFLDKCVDDVLRLGKFCNNTCFSWLGKTSMMVFVPIATLYQFICLLILLLRVLISMLYFHMWKFLAVTVHPIKNIDKKRKEYKEAKKVLNLICNQMGTSNKYFKEPLFEAVRQDKYEVVDEILSTSPAKINCEDEEGYNIIQLAIINRAEKVYNLVHHIIERRRFYREMTDSFENTLIHLAGRLAPSFVLERTTGAALQLQRELLWREEVKKLVLPFELREVNKNRETPSMVFTREHRDLMKEGENWMKTTAESGSITAALIVTVLFAAAITVPGGSDQQSGIPVLKNETAFTIFAVSNALSLFTATAALLLSLSILTARFSEEDFLVSLPRKLIFGLLMLFFSTTSMMVAFGTILFLVFCDQRPWMLAPIFVFACLPISVIVTIKLPLLVDLFQSTYFPIFGNRSYLESCRVNRKNTIFTD